MSIKPSTALYLKAHYNKEREPQTEDEIKFILDSFLKDGYENSEYNRRILSEIIHKEYRGIFSMANLREVAYGRGKELERELKSSRPIGRTVEQEELQSMLQQVFAANPWLGFTHRNVDLISKVFLFDERIPPAHQRHVQRWHAERTWFARLSLSRVLRGNLLTQVA
jgi:hypothetical protein